MRKILPVLITSTLALGVVSCSNDSDTSTGAATTAIDGVTMPGPSVDANFDGNYDGLYRQYMTDPSQGGVELIVDGTNVALNIVYTDGMPPINYWKGVLPDTSPSGTLSVPPADDFPDGDFTAPKEPMEITFDNGVITYVDNADGYELPYTMERVGDVTDATPLGPGPGENTTFSDGELTTNTAKLKVVDVIVVPRAEDSEVDSPMLAVEYDFTNLNYRDDSMTHHNYLSLEQTLADGTVEELSPGQREWSNYSGDREDELVTIPAGETQERIAFYNPKPGIKEITITFTDPETGEVAGTKSYPVTIPGGGQ